jgi:formylglycine-generating enzyme required for sulfatase activity
VSEDFGFRLLNVIVRHKIALYGICTVFAASVVAVMAGCSRSVRVLPKETFRNSVGMEMVALSTGYYVSRFETTQGEYESVVGSNPMSPSCSACPVANVTGQEAELFCVRLTELERSRGTLPKGYVYRLPSFSQWLEYVGDAPLAGSVTPVGGRGGANLDGPLPVGSGEVNSLGLYDLRGNVAEYLCEPYNTGSLTIVGAWWSEHRDEFLQLRNRSGFMNKDVKGTYVGFRCVLVRRE